MQRHHPGYILAILSLLFFLIYCKNDPASSQKPPDPVVVIEESEPVKDSDGNVYRTVKIGNQIWMAENLRKAGFAEDQPIENFYYNNDTSYIKTHGRLYRYAAAMNKAASSSANPSKVRGISPVGWHLPSNAEWQVLINNLGGAAVAGGKLKAIGTSQWSGPNTGATNESKFNALGSGFFRVDNVYMAMKERAIFLTTDSSSPILVRTLRYNSSEVLVEQFHPQDAVSIRCVKD